MAKQPAACPRCQTVTAPTNATIQMVLGGLAQYVALRRYACACGRVWADAAQRAFNRTLVDRAHKRATQPGGWFS